MDSITRDYTSARISTQDRYSFRYGRFEARLRMPVGRGIWPAFWALGIDIDRVGWPECGEIDVVEYLGQEPTTATGTIHGPGTALARTQTTSLAARSCTPPHWHKNSIRMVCSGCQAVSSSISTVVPIGRSPPRIYRQDHGGCSTTGSFSFSTSRSGEGGREVPMPARRFPQALLVDYVRVYQ